MKRDRIENLKHNAKLDVRLPDQLKDEFLARCREEGVSSGAVIRSLMIDYVTARPRRWSVMAAGVWETIMKRAKWIAGGVGGSALAGLAAMSFVFAPMANAEDYAVNFDVQLVEHEGYQTRRNRMETTVRLDSGELHRMNFPNPGGEPSAAFAIELRLDPCSGSSPECPEGGVDIQMTIIRMHDETVLSSPRFFVLAGQPASLTIDGEEGPEINVAIRAEALSAD
ncbi:MAG: hypothetical protein JKP96_03980 [Oceanicaulis sp.]|jgi:hypothetical protein|uniref:hypothetical protein n=1 Tax=Oceanicaulis alexandrii TaxID=153233 RepID=UPI001A3ABA37|nr:hypothetical protein [Oceanicaulis sp.]|tara:strand:- start:29 stop:703 length:675 start_codon:yes stop_codon:yes gene_type:complete